MGFTNGILTAPFTKIAANGQGDLQKAIGRTSCYDHIQLIGDVDGQGNDVGRIKKFAKYKPFRDTTVVFPFDPTKSTPELRSPARWQAAKGQRYGLNPAPILTQSGATMPSTPWTYNKPTLPTYPLRALDLDGYYTYAVSPIRTDMPGAIWYAGSVMNFRVILDPVGEKTYFDADYCITNEDALGEMYHKTTSPGWYVSMVIFAKTGNSGAVVSTISSGKTPKQLIDNENGIWNLTWDVPNNYAGKTLTFQFCLANLPTAGEYTPEQYNPFEPGNAYSLEYEEGDGRAVVDIQVNPGGVASLYNLVINAFSLYDTQDASLVHDIWMFNSGISVKASATSNWDARYPLSVYTTLKVANGSINSSLDNPVTSYDLTQNVSGFGDSLNIPNDEASHTYTLASQTLMQQNIQVYIPKGQTAWVSIEAYGIDFLGNRIDFPTQIYTLNQ